MENIRVSTYNWKDTGHPQKYIKDLGISYRYAIPQPILDCWWFLGCENVPTDTPYIAELVVGSYEELLGFGLDKNMVNELEAWREANGK